MATTIPRVYRSFAEFERCELRRFDALHHADGVLEEMLAASLRDADEALDGGDDGILFDRIED